MNGKTLITNLRFLLVLSVLVFFFEFVTLGDRLPMYFFAYDNQSEHCLENFNFALLATFRDKNPLIHRGDTVFWKPSGALSFVQAKWVVKKIAATAGDDLEVTDEKVIVNGNVIFSEINKISYAEKSAQLAFIHSSISGEYSRPEKFLVHEVIPSGSVFVLGDNPGSYDSRYWGYLRVSDILGKAYGLF